MPKSNNCNWPSDRNPTREKNMATPHIPPIPVPDLRNIKPNGGQPPLADYIVTVESGDDVLIRTYRAHGYNVDAPGNLHIVRDGRVVASLAAGIWLEAHLAGYVPEEEQTLRHGYGPLD
jgi:hypothetical protein